MAEYLVFHGTWASGRDSDDPGLVAFKSDGKTISVRGPRQMAKRWADIAENSSAVAYTAFSEPENILWRLMFSNKMASWSYFTDDNGYDKYRDVYDKVQGTTIKVTITPRDWNEPKPPRRQEK